MNKIKLKKDSQALKNLQAEEEDPLENLPENMKTVTISLIVAIIISVMGALLKLTIKLSSKFMKPKTISHLHMLIARKLWKVKKYP
jgi:hypothetical protein